MKTIKKYQKKFVLASIVAVGLLTGTNPVVGWKINCMLCTLSSAGTPDNFAFQGGPHRQVTIEYRADINAEPTISQTNQASTGFLEIDEIKQ